VLPIELRTDLAKPEIVLVRGAFADAAGWQKVVQILQRDRFFGETDMR
jgi:hypothetical protein